MRHFSLQNAHPTVVASAFTNGQQYVIYSGTTALAYNGNNLTTATVTVENNTVVRSSSDNIVWTATQSGTSWRLYHDNRYLRARGAQGLDTRDGGNNDCNWDYDNYNHRLSRGNLFLSLNGSTWGVTTNANQAATVYIARVEEEPASGDLTYYYYNADHSASIASSETAETLTNTWTDVSTLAKTIPGYKFIEARANSVDGDIILQVNNRSYRTGTSGAGSALTDIYFIYMKDYVAGEDIIPDLNGPITEKSVTPNSDGTFTIRLDITGVVNDVKHGANVVIVFDRTSSMSGRMSSTDRTLRINAAISAVNTMVNTLNPGTGENQNDIDFALVEFDRNAEIYDFGASGIAGHTEWTKSGSALTTRVGRYEDGANLAASGATPGAGGTNWQAALQQTAAVLENKPDADPTYVVFMTDGEPTIYIGSNSVLNNRTTNDPEYSRSVPYAEAIVDAGYLMYDIFCSASDTTLLESLYTTSGAKSYVEAETQEAIEDAFEAVANAMLDAIGSSDVATDDGVPELGDFDLATVDGQLQLSDARYYKNGQPWADAPVATPSSGGVKWDLSSVGTLVKDTVYSIEFEIWPSQEAYDLIADLNNGLRSYEADGENPITDEERAQITKVSDTEYTLKTNTYLKTSYKLYGAVHNDDVDFTEDAMDLPTKKISVKKLWPENMLDEHGEAEFYDEETGETIKASEILLTLLREKEEPETGFDNYLDVLVKSPSWAESNIYVSCGFMTVKEVDGEKVVDIKEPGHDYQIVEPDGFSWYWDLISDVYHPMVINGKDTILIYNPDLTAADVDNETVFEIEEGRFYEVNDNTSGNTLEASNYRRSNLNLTKALAVTDDNALFEYKVTVNDSNSLDGFVWFSAWDPVAEDYVYDFDVTGGNVEKETKDIPEGATMNDDDTCTFINSDGDSETHPVAGDGKYYTGYFYATNGAELTLKIKAGWNVRFINLYHGTTFDIEETDMPDVYEFDSVDASTRWDIKLDSNKDWYEIEVDEDEVQTGVITGTITEPNNQFTVKYTNKPKPQFYVYHSSDNTVECIQLSDARVNEDDGTFDIAAETKAGYIYGGYYKAYGDTKATDTEITGLTYNDGTVSYEYPNANTGGEWASDAKGNPYTGSKATAWKKANAYTDKKGTEMIPHAGIVYYLKEVPDSYFRPYIQIVYDTYHKNAAGENDYPLVGLYLLTATDDANYTDAGIWYDDSAEKTAGKLSATLKITDSTGKATTLTAKSVFDGKQYDDKKAAVPRGYLTAIDLSSSIASVDEFSMRPYLKTLDGVKVYGVTERTVDTGDKTFVDDGNGASKKPGINVTDAKSIKVYE